MTILLRNEDNIHLASFQVGLPMCLTVSLNLRAYSKLLLANIDRSGEVIEDFAYIANMEKWFDKVYVQHTDEPCITDIAEQIKALLFMPTKKYNLNILTK